MAETGGQATGEVETAVRDLTDEVINFSEEGSEALTAAELSQGRRSYANIKEQADAAAAKAEVLAAPGRLADAAREAADAAEREVDRINSQLGHLQGQPR